MIVTPAYAALMARYNLWQNTSLLAAADGLGAAARDRDRGAFFGSIRGTFSHVLWADLMWLSRFEDSPPPEGGVKGSAGLFPDWPGLVEMRRAADRRIQGWADRLTPEALSDEMTWFSGVLGREVTKPLGLCVAHFFNHQTHHRGQVHAMLTAEGARPGDTDLVMMPEEIGM